MLFNYPRIIVNKGRFHVWKFCPLRGGQWKRQWKMITAIKKFMHLIPSPSHFVKLKSFPNTFNYLHKSTKVCHYDPRGWKQNKPLLWESPVSLTTASDLILRCIQTQPPGTGCHGNDDLIGRPGNQSGPLSLYSVSPTLSPSLYVTRIASDIASKGKEVLYYSTHSLGVTHSQPSPLHIPIPIPLYIFVEACEGKKESFKWNLTFSDWRAFQ